MLADFGAEVVRVEPPGGDPLWDEPVALLVHRGKRSVAVDLGRADGRDELLRIVGGSDVVLEALDPGEPERLGIDAHALTGAHPGLVHCSISGFGATGPLAGLPADDALVMARAGVFRDQPGRHRGAGRPVFRNTREPSFGAAMLAVEAVLAALRARSMTGTGQRIETSLLQSLVWRLNPFIRTMLRDGTDPSVDGGFGVPIANGPSPLGAEMTGMLLETADGRWIVHQLFERDFFPNWVHVLDMDWIWDDERFAGAPRGIADPAARVELAGLFAARVKEHTADEWMARYLANGQICADVIRTTQEALRHPQVIAGDYLVEVDDPRVGRIVELGPLAKIPGAPANVRGPAPAPGADRAASVASAGDRRDEPPSARPSIGADELRAGPLSGVTIVEPAIFYATCAGTAQLADLGARVIKVEPLAGDPYRRAVQGIGFDNLARSLQGKESIAIDLKDPRGREILHRLAARADAFVHNFRVGVPERLGADHDTIKAVNPRIVYLYAASYGSTGPYARQPAIDHIIAAFAGTTAHQTGAGDLPLKEQGADPVASLGVGAALMLGLTARDRTGEGQYVESAMIQSNLFLNVEDALAYDGKPPRRGSDGLQLGTAATYRLYATAAPPAGSACAPWEDPASRWVFLAVTTDDAFARFCAAAGRDDLARDDRFATEAARGVHDLELAAELEELFLTRSAREWESLAVAARVGCVVADAASFHAFLHRDEQAAALGMTARTSHPAFGGAYWRPAPAVALSSTPGTVGPYCEIGEHTRAILRELGYDEETVARLKDGRSGHLARRRSVTPKRQGSGERPAPEGRRPLPSTDLIFVFGEYVIVEHLYGTTVFQAVPSSAMPVRQAGKPATCDFGNCVGPPTPGSSHVKVEATFCTFSGVMLLLPFAATFLSTWMKKSVEV